MIWTLLDLFLHIFDLCQFSASQFPIYKQNDCLPCAASYYIYFCITLPLPSPFNNSTFQVKILSICFEIPLSFAISLLLVLTKHKRLEMHDWHDL